MEEWKKDVSMSGLERNARGGRHAPTRGLPPRVGSLLGRLHTITPDAIDARLHLAIDQLEMACQLSLELRCCRCR